MPICQICFAIKDRLQPGPLEGAGECSSPHCYFFPCCESCPECKDYLDRIRGEGRYTVVIPVRQLAKWEIELTDEEMEFAREIGVLRCTHAKKNRLENKYGAQGYSESKHIMGARGEKAAAKRMGLEWIKPFKLGGYKEFTETSDLPSNIEVRTVNESHRRLILHEWDRDANFVSVLEAGKRYLLRGWLPAREGKRKEWWEVKREGGGAFYVPGFFLKSMDDLKW